MSHPTREMYMWDKEHIVQDRKKVKKHPSKYVHPIVREPYPNHLQEIREGASSSYPIDLPMTDFDPVDCKDCGGSGEYTGLNSVEKCKACGGAGATLV